MDDSMRLVSWNILSGMPLREGANLFDAINELAADVIALQEVDHLQDRSNGMQTTIEIAQRCGFHDWAFGPTLHGTPGSSWSPAIDISTSHQKNELPTSYGIALLSKIPVLSWHYKRLRRSPIGLPLLVTTPQGARVAYVKDEPRVGVAAVLENGITVIAAHLSFVPPVNSLQLRSLKRWAQELPGKKIFIGDLNALLFGKAGLKSLHRGKSYPGWDPKVKFDFILSDEVVGTELKLDYPGVSDHLPIGVDIHRVD